MSIRQRLYPDEGAAVALSRHCADARFVWNLGLEQRKCWRPGGPAVNAATQCRQLTEARGESEWLREGSAVVQQAALRDLDRAYRNWWSNPGHFGRPTWRKAGVHEGFHVRDLAVARLNRKWATVSVPKLGPVKFRLTRAWQDVQAGTSARVTKDRCGRWWVSIATPPPSFPRAPTGRAAGIDRGVANSIATSDGAMGHAPGLTEGEQARFLSLQQRLARQAKGSNRRDATRRKLARLHAKLGDRRRDWIEQTTTALARAYDAISIEDLRVKNMTKKPAPKPDPGQDGAHLSNGARAKAGLNRAILASCWGGLARRLADKTTAAGTRLIAVDPRDTSRECAECHHVAKENRESQAVFCCRACGHLAHADTNAATIIRERGLALLAARPAEETPNSTRPEDIRATGRTRRTPRRAASTTQAA